MRLAFPLFLLTSLCFGKTVVSFSRRLNTCDAQDLPIQNATTKVVWAYNDNLPQSETQIMQHTARGISPIRFHNPTVMAPLPEGTHFVDVVLKNDTITFDSLLGPTTTYWCTGHYVPPIGEKTQLIRMEPLIDQKAYVHHMHLYLCNSPVTSNYHGSCFDNPPADIQGCVYTAMVASYGVGGGAFDYPEKVGFPLPENGFYVVMETHYNNAGNKASLVDSSGMRLYYTNKLRQWDAGEINLGAMVNGALTIPAGQDNYIWNAYCPPECTNKFPTVMNIFGVALHTHVAGRSGGLFHYRNGTRLPTIFEEPYYDFNYQQMSLLPQEIQVLPGDVLHTYCGYDTADRTQPTKMGFPTFMEMCMTLVVYYPKIPNLDYCNYGNFTGILPGEGEDIYCGLEYIKNVSKTVVPPLDPPVPCTRVPPPQELTTPKFASEPLDFSKFVSNTTLDGDEGKVKLYWTIDDKASVIHAALEYETNGWVGFGITPAGMVNADVAIGWKTTDGNMFWADRLAVQEALPPKDVLQDYYNVTFYPLASTSSSSSSSSSSTSSSTSTGATATPGLEDCREALPGMWECPPGHKGRNGSATHLLPLGLLSFLAALCFLLSH